MAELQKKSTGQDVRNLQVMLAHYGYNPGKIDAEFGLKTDKAVRDFQKANKLPDDGKVGSKTQAALKSHLNANPSKGLPRYVNVTPPNTLNLRSTDNDSRQPIGFFNQGDLIFIKNQQGNGKGWVEVSPPYKGWVSAKFLK